ncbi:MAG: hypothetical protein HKN50_02735 [Gammaproteobacteria bacterium]|nr:hypothetical protein [Gammaproteobacteria bacterium]
MDIKRLGSFHATRLSFMRFLMRRLMGEQWQISTARNELDEEGYGTVVYRMQANGNVYNWVAFSQYLPDELRNDRVIAEQWDVTMALCAGDVSDAELADLRRNVPKQEGGRYNSKVLVLSRGNKSSRNFAYVVDCLAAGRQPDMQKLADVGYLYRTTAVYGSGKFGMADWEKVLRHCSEFAHPFSAEMFNCYMLRHFSVQQAEHLASIKSPDSAVAMDVHVQRFLGIGNATGLGMAPYLIRHPKLISRWVLQREKAIAHAVYANAVTPDNEARLRTLLAQAIQHVRETNVPDQAQRFCNDILAREMQALLLWLRSANYPANESSWAALVEYVNQHYSVETQEMINSLLIELDDHSCQAEAQYTGVDESYHLQPAMLLTQLQKLIEQHYDWALSIDFDTEAANHFFWYRSEEKMEPRLGERFNEPGADREMPLTVARQVRHCYDQLLSCMAEADAPQTVAELVIDVPELGGIIKRMQSMAQECYGEIRANLADKNMLPLDLLRCKLSFFGVGKFDPKSSLWVRNTMFQGAPVAADIGQPFSDDWFFPVAAADDRAA